MKRYYVADTWSDGVNNYCYILTMSTTEGVKVYVALVVGESYIMDEDVTEAVENVVPLADMFADSYEIDSKNIYARVKREEYMARKKEYETAILVRINKAQHEKIKAIAEEKNKSIADILRDYIKRAKSPKK